MDSSAHVSISGRSLRFVEKVACGLDPRRRSRLLEVLRAPPFLLCLACSSDFTSEFCVPLFHICFALYLRFSDDEWNPVLRPSGSPKRERNQAMEKQVPFTAAKLPPQLTQESHERVNQHSIMPGEILAAPALNVTDTTPGFPRGRIIRRGHPHYH
jgi:hypothetical protein